ncbi:MAG: hypothetical protein BGO21_00195 [Dyadobacter sp. 50-39]|uniref:sensor histidine kinase n=1 Tax=Dyadobacter sp. 50-39 TaxID=1895756 RepID=UPI00095D7C09|nr:histidine kinase [Dyadobacter sp. 50-39]OJV21697.1 MAG: hypothetical protein BGO21_00195 [Dyadobacter sp. 50-39]
MQTFTEELYTFRKILFPATTGQRVLVHMTFWSFFVGFHLLIFLPAHDEKLKNPAVLWAYILYYGRCIPVYYLMVLFFRFLRKRIKSPWRVLLLVIFGLVLYHLVTVVLYQYYQHYVGMERLPDGFHKMGRLYLEPFGSRQGRDWTVFIYDISELQLLILPFSVKMMKHSIHLVSEQFVLQQQRLQSELKYMRSQLTPHFIFNILNAVSVEIKYSPKKAADVLFKAADMIRFSIYDIEKEFISLEKELHYVEQYVELESMRTSQRSEICFIKKGQISATHQVPTLFLVTLVENAFKHSVHATHERSQISIITQIKGRWLIFEVTNSKPSQVTEKKSEEQKGIGLSNLRKTLALKFGKDQLLDITESDKSFSVLLRLPLSSRNAPLI